MSQPLFNINDISATAIIDIEVSTVRASRLSSIRTVTIVHYELPNEGQGEPQNKQVIMTCTGPLAEYLDDTKVNIYPKRETKNANFEAAHTTWQAFIYAFVMAYALGIEDATTPQPTDDASDTE